MPDPLGPGQRCGHGLQAVAAEVHENQCPIGLKVDQVTGAGAIQIGQQYSRGLEFGVGEGQGGEYEPFAKSPPAQIWPALDFIMTNAHQMLLATAQQIAERHQFSFAIAGQWQIVIGMRHVRGRGKTLRALVAIEPHTVAANQRQVVNTLAHQVGKPGCRLEKLQGQRRKGREV